MVDFSRCHIWCYMFRLLLLSHEGKSKVIGPSQPIVAIVDEDIILPCCLEPPVNASGMVLEWARTDLSPGFVYERYKSEEYVARQQPSYKGRTSVSIDKLELGDASMKLSNVTRSDEGTYRCFFPQLGQHALIGLVVGIVSSPVISSVNVSNSRVLQCEAKGWYPEPEVFWLDGEGNLLSAGPTETVRGPDDLYTVSRRLTVRKSDRFICRVQQKNINKMRETHFYVPEDFFPVQSSLSWIWIIISIINILVVLLFIFLTFRCFRIRRRRRAAMKSVNNGSGFPMSNKQGEQLDNQKNTLQEAEKHLKKSVTSQKSQEEPKVSSQSENIKDGGTVEETVQTPGQCCGEIAEVNVDVRREESDQEPLMSDVIFTEA